MSIQTGLQWQPLPASQMDCIESALPDCTHSSLSVEESKGKEKKGKVDGGRKWELVWGDALENDSFSLSCCIYGQKIIVHLSSDPMDFLNLFTCWGFTLNFSDTINGTSSRTAERRKREKQSWTLHQQNILIFSLKCNYFLKSERRITKQQSYHHPQPPQRLPAFRLQREDERLFFFYSQCMSTSTLSSSPALFQFNYSWLFPILSCLRDVHLWNKDALAL